MTGRLERSAAFWLRAYPPSWRAERAAEVTEVLVDLADDGARRLDARTALGLLRGGIATRWRQTPPLRVYLPYRMLNLRVPVEYREWVRQDLTSPGYLRRDLLARAWMFVLPVYTAVTTDARRDSLVMWTVLGIATTATVLSIRPGVRLRRALQYHLRPHGDEPRTLSGLVWVRTSRARIAAEPAARVLVLLLAVGAAAWSTAVITAPSRLSVVACAAPEAGGCFDVVVTGREPWSLIAAPLVAVAVAGAVLAVVVARRLGRRLPSRPPQPHRHLVGLAPHADVATVLWIGLILAEATAEVTGAWVLSLSVVAAPVCLLLLPAAVVLWARARETPDAALVDLRRAAWTGRAIEVDRPDTELVPAPVQEFR